MRGAAAAVSIAGIAAPLVLGGAPGRPAAGQRRLLRARGEDLPCRAVRRRGAVDHRVPGARADHLRARHRRYRDGLARARGRRPGRCRGVGHPGDRPRQLHRKHDAGGGRGRRRRCSTPAACSARCGRCSGASTRRPRSAARCRRGCSRSCWRRSPPAPGSPTSSASTRCSARSSSARRRRTAASRASSRPASSR